MSMVRKRSNQAGFTMIELLIATAVFSVVLLTVTVAIIQFTRQYYRGLIANSTQNTSRAIIDEISRSIQFNTGEVKGISDDSTGLGLLGYCVGTSKIYSYSLNRQVTDSGAVDANHQSKYGVVVSNVPNCTSNTTPLDSRRMTSLPDTASYKSTHELLGQHMRLSKFSIDGSGSNYTITVKVIYGDDDLLCSPSSGTDCATSSSRTGVNANSPDLTCRSTSGSQFCSVSELTTTVTKRVDQ